MKEEQGASAYIERVLTTRLLVLAYDLLTVGSRTLKEKQGRLCSSASCSACSVTPTWLGVRVRARVGTGLGLANPNPNVTPTAKEVPTKTMAFASPSQRRALRYW